MWGQEWSHDPKRRTKENDEKIIHNHARSVHFVREWFRDREEQEVRTATVANRASQRRSIKARHLPARDGRQFFGLLSRQEGNRQGLGPFGRRAEKDRGNQRHGRAGAIEVNRTRWHEDEVDSRVKARLAILSRRNAMGTPNGECGGPYGPLFFRSRIPA